MKFSFKIIVLLFIICRTSISFSQKLDHVQGDIIVMLDLDESPNNLLAKYKRFKDKDTNIKIEQIIDYPLNIWNITIDYTRINENDIKKAIDNQPEVMASQQNHVFKYRRVPNDPFFNQQWQYINTGTPTLPPDVDTDIEDAWDITTGGLTALGDTIVVCVIDDGIDKNHQDLIPNYWINKNEIPDNGMDDDANGYIDDVYGWDAINDDGNVFREGSHGTSVAGVIGAKGNNNVGVSGVNWDVKIMNIRGGSNATNGIKAYLYPYLQRKLYNESGGKEGAFVVATNASWGFPYKKEVDSPVFCAFYDALGEIGIINATATTNENLNVDKDGDLPTNCSSPFLIAVTNLTKSGMIASSAGYGPVSIDLAAPGNRIYTTGKPDRYREFEGTSGSSPLVAGAVGLMYAVPCPDLINLAKSDPGAAALRSKEIILGTVDHNSNMAGLTLTQGTLNIGKAVTSASDMCSECTFPANITSISKEKSLELTWDKPGFAASSGIRYRELGKEWLYRENLQNDYTIENLSNCTLYEVQIRSACDQMGPYSHSYYFETDNCCKPPENIQIENNSNRIVVNWEDISAADNYNIEFSPIGEENWQKAVVSESQFILYGITSCSTFKFRINSKCGFQTTEFTNEINNTINCNACQNSDYCGDVFMDNDFEWINSIKIDSFMFESGKNTAGYGNYIGLPGIVVQQGEEVDMEITIEYDGISFNENAAAFFDWNQNGIFEQEERAFNPNAGSNTISESVFVPINALPGITRMRVILSYENITSACKDLTIESGEIEDYCVVVQSAAQCSNEMTVDNFSTTSSSISLLWTEVQDAESYIIEYKDESEEDFIALSSDSTEITIGNLTECSAYNIRVKSVCSAGETAFSRSSTIRTRCSTSVHDPTGLLKSYSITPNPFSDVINIKLEGNFTNPGASIILYNINGQETNRLHTEMISGSNFQLNNLTSLPAGIYLLHIQNGPLAITEKVVKMQ